MGLLDFIFGKTIKIEHPFFGQMIYVGAKKNSKENYFECGRQFKPKKDKIEIGIEGDIGGPTQRQIDFFESIEKNYTNFSDSMILLIESEFRNWKEDFKIKDFQKEFTPVYLFIPRCETEPIIWEIGFESEHDENHLFTLTMENFKATEILIDG
jgi:hypothetical protein